MLLLLLLFYFEYKNRRKADNPKGNKVDNNNNKQKELFKQCMREKNGSNQYKREEYRNIREHGKQKGINRAVRTYNINLCDKKSFFLLLKLLNFTFCYLFSIVIIVGMIFGDTKKEDEREQ